MPQRSYRILLSFAVILVLCVAVYVPGIFGGFLFDDYPNIINNPWLSRAAQGHPDWLAIALSSGSGALRRPISMLSFGLNADWFGFSPLAFKVTNLLIHLVNGVLLFALCRRIASFLSKTDGETTALQPTVLSLLATGLWLLHPLNVSDVVYVVQRMNALSALFSLAGLLAYTEGRARMQQGEQGLALAISGLTGFGLLALLSKENGALIFAYAFVIEITCFRFQSPLRDQQNILKAFFGLSVALPIAAFLVFLLLHPQWLPGSYAIRDFTLSQRVLTEARILCDYLLWIFLPVPAWLGLFHDDIATSTGLLQPVTTIFAILFLIALIGCAWRLRHRSPGVTFGIAWFLVGHALESTILPLELVFEHRNYLPMAGLLAGLICAVTLITKESRKHWGVVGGALLLLLAGLTAMRAAHWGDNPLNFALEEVRHHPLSSRAQYEAGRAIIVDGAVKGARDAAEQQALSYLERSAALDHNQVYPLTNLILIKASAGPVPGNVLAELAERLRRSPTYVQANPFLDMLVAASERKVSLTPQDFSMLVDAAFENPHFTAPIRAMILNNYGAYMFNVAHDSQAAIDFTVAAAAQDPLNPYFQINLTKLALALGDPKQALTHLTLATRLNRTGLYDQEIADLTQQIASLKH